MARKLKQSPRRHRAEPAAGDTAWRSLSEEDRARLSMDAWEPSLLRNLLKAQDKLKRRRSG